MPSPADIRTRPDIDRLLTAFYADAFADATLGPIFVDVAKMDLDSHLPVIGDFWENVLFGSRKYRGDPLPVHRRLDALVPLTPELFARWLMLWDAAVDRTFVGERAERAKVQAGRIAAMLGRRLGTGPPAAAGH